MYEDSSGTRFGVFHTFSVISGCFDDPFHVGFVQGSGPSAVLTPPLACRRNPCVVVAVVSDCHLTPVITVRVVLSSVLEYSYALSCEVDRAIQSFSRSFFLVHFTLGRPVLTFHSPRSASSVTYRSGPYYSQRLLDCPPGTRTSSLVPSTLTDAFQTLCVSCSGPVRDVSVLYLIQKNLVVLGT